jgi:hypothetical protein
LKNIACKKDFGSSQHLSLFVCFFKTKLLVELQLGQWNSRECLFAVIVEQRRFARLFQLDLPPEIKTKFLMVYN